MKVERKRWIVKQRERFHSTFILADLVTTTKHWCSTSDSKNSSQSVLVIALKCVLHELV